VPTVTAPTGPTTSARSSRRRAAWIVAIVIVAAGIPVAVLNTRGHHAQTVARPDLQRVLVELTSASGQIARGATAYVAGPRGTWPGVAGVADVATGEPMPVDARMRLGSVSKIWTAVLVLQRAEQGRLGLNDRVERWLPGLLAFGNRSTLGQLLTHTSGVFDTTTPSRTRPGAGPGPGPVRHAELVRLARRRRADPTTRVPAYGLDPAGRPRRGSSRPAAATATPTSAWRSSGWCSSRRPASRSRRSTASGSSGRWARPYRR
jgi:CubicO group peptidase (beta-lactamase class C family)